MGKMLFISLLSKISVPKVMPLSELLNIRVILGILN
jgi:hypothetical protein